MTDFTSALGGTFINPFKEYKQAKIAGANGGSAATVAVGHGVASMGTSITKGALVGFPLALAEGLRNAPKLHGEQVERAEVKDWKSGSVFAAKVSTHYQLLPCFRLMNGRILV
jgi:sterol 3beta-glucosyltransferase